MRTTSAHTMEIENSLSKAVTKLGFLPGLRFWLLDLRLIATR